MFIPWSRRERLQSFCVKVYKHWGDPMPTVNVHCSGMSGLSCLPKGINLSTFQLTTNCSYLEYFLSEEQSSWFILSFKTPYILFIWPQNAAVRIRAVYKETCLLHHTFCDHIQSIKNITQLAEKRMKNEKNENPSFNVYLYI